MNKQILTGIILGVITLGATAQVQFRQGDLMRLGELTAAKSSASSFIKSADRARKDRVEAIIRYDSESALDEIRAKGGEIISLVGTRTAIVSFAPGNAEAIAASRGVTGARLSRLMKHANNQALAFSKIPDVQSGKGLPQGYKGAGVVIGLFDTGLDPNHINFRDAEGNSRVKALWEYSDQSAIPTIYDTPAKLSTFTAETRSESHGTHVLGIMTGSFVDESTPDAPDYRGVAPEAEIVIGCGEGYDAQILDALERIGKYAQQQNKPCVMNLSFGDNLGPHDGTDEFTEAINDIAAKYDAVLCLAGGNERDEKISLVKELTDNDSSLKTLFLQGSETGNYQTFGEVQIWTTDGTPFEVSLDIISKSNPNTPVYSFVIPEKKAAYVEADNAMNEFFTTSERSKMNITKSGTEFHTYYSGSFMGGIRGVDPYNKRYTAQLNLYLVSRSTSYSSKYFCRLNVKGQPGKKIFVYCDGYYMTFGSRDIPGLEVPTGYGTNSNMACGTNTLSVGSYVTANIADSGYPAGTIGDISYFSSWGETPDGRVMPDICAPGQVIVSSRNTYMATTGNMAYYYPLEYSYRDNVKRTTYYWTSCAGTSQASPHAAGIAALWRGANPQLSAQEIYTVARESAAAPGFPSTGWGHGKIDAMAGMKSILNMSSVDDIIENSSESITVEKEGGVYRISALGQTSVTASLYNLQGIEMKHMSTPGEELTLDITGLPSGVYVLKVEGSHTSRTLKLTL